SIRSVLTAQTTPCGSNSGRPWTLPLYVHSLATSNAHLLASRPLVLSASSSGRNRFATKKRPQKFGSIQVMSGPTPPAYWVISLSASSPKLADSSVILTLSLPSRMFMTGEIMVPHQWARRRFATCLEAAGCAAGATVAPAAAAAGFEGAGVGAGGAADEQAS